MSPTHYTRNPLFLPRETPPTKDIKRGVNRRLTERQEQIFERFLGAPAPGSIPQPADPRIRLTQEEIEADIAFRSGEEVGVGIGGALWNIGSALIDPHFVPQTEAVLGALFKGAEAQAEGELAGAPFIPSDIRREAIESLRGIDDPARVEERKKTAKEVAPWVAPTVLDALLGAGLVGRGTRAAGGVVKKVAETAAERAARKAAQEAAARAAARVPVPGVAGGPVPPRTSATQNVGRRISETSPDVPSPTKESFVRESDPGPVPPRTGVGRFTDDPWRQRPTVTPAARVGAAADVPTPVAPVARKVVDGTPPRPSKKPGQVGGADPSDVLDDVEVVRLKDEKVNEALIRQHTSSIRTAENEVRIIVDEGSNLLRSLGIGRIVRGRLLPRIRDVARLDDLYDALHNPSLVASGEMSIPRGLEAVYRQLRGLMDWESAARIDFDPNMATIEDYFYRGWKPPEDVVRAAGPSGELGRVPGFKKPRTDATYREMREAGFEPLYLNPYEQFRVARLQGIRYRQQVKLIDAMKSSGLAVPHAGGPIPEGWRVPKVGPAFEGKPFAYATPEGEARTMFTKRWIVESDTANRLENFYGVRPNMGKIHVGGKEIDLLKVVDFVTFVPKRAKLFLSIFQQRDFLQRSAIGSWTSMVDDLRRGKPVAAVMDLARWPKSAYKIIEANASPKARAALRRELNSTTPLVSGRPGVHLRGVMESGLSTIDVTIFPSNMDSIARSVAQEGGWLTLRPIRNAIADMESAMRRGLFEGTYPAAQITDIKNNIAPMIERQFGHLTDQQINGLIAKITNIKYSTIPADQSIFQNPFVRELLRRVFFSIGESEGLLRQAAGAMRGPNKAYWRKHWLATYLSAMVTANAIHYASTGKSLPFERWTPVSKDNYGPLPLGYNSDFAAPTLPVKGRGETEVMLDIMGQMDTALRLLDPGGFVNSRFSVPIRAFQDQATGKNFFEENLAVGGLNEFYKRTYQLAQTLLFPIGLGGLADIAVENVPALQDVTTEGEARLGTTGLLLQATGLNLRAETTPNLLARAARESGFLDPYGSPIQGWNDLSPEQKLIVEAQEPLKSELQQRQETALERGSEGARVRQEFEKITKDRLKKERALDAELESGKIDGPVYRERFDDIQAESAAERAKIDEVFQAFKRDGVLPEAPWDRALAQYYDAWEKARTESGILDYERLDTEFARLEAEWTDMQKEYVEKNTGLAEHSAKGDQLRRDKEILRQGVDGEPSYWEIGEDFFFADAMDTLHWQQWLRAHNTLKRKLEEDFPIINVGKKKQRELRKDMRARYPRVDNAIVRWYGGTATERVFVPNVEQVA